MSIFKGIGPYRIERELGSGGMARVLLATDTRSGRLVALKIVRDGEDADAREILAAEQRGAELQQRFSSVSQYVPEVYEFGFADGYFYIAMEYIDGEDLSWIIRRGPMAPERVAAIAVQLCQFLEEVDRVMETADGQARLTLLHNDLKPTNVRVVAGDRVKVLDFGAAKALSLSRRVTRNDFGSLAYLSPECLETGERDRRTDAWSLGVLLYEMVAGRQPFRADDTRRLEVLIQSRQPPAPLAACPAGLQAVIAKLLASDPAARYDCAAAIRADLERFIGGEPTLAEQDVPPLAGMVGVAGAAGIADSVDAPTRRTGSAAHDEAPTRRTRQPEPDQSPTRATARPADGPGAVSPAGESRSTAPTPEASAASARRLGMLRKAALFALLFVVANEGCVALKAQRLAASVPMQEFAGLTNVWTEYESLANRSYLGRMGLRTLERELTRQSTILAERVIANYRTPKPSVMSRQWEAAAAALQRALSVTPGDDTLRGALRYAEGHVRRINGEEADKSARTAATAQREFAEAITAFREAAALRPDWPDPFLGLARTFIYGLKDIDRGADAIAQAQKLGYVAGEREIAQLADGYAERGEALERAAAKLDGMPQARDLLTRAMDAFRQAQDHYSQVPTFGNALTRIRGLERDIERVRRRLDGLPWL